MENLKNIFLKKNIDFRFWGNHPSRHSLDRSLGNEMIWGHHYTFWVPWMLDNIEWITKKLFSEPFQRKSNLHFRLLSRIVVNFTIWYLKFHAIFFLNQKPIDHINPLKDLNDLSNIPNSQYLVRLTGPIFLMFVFVRRGRDDDSSELTQLWKTQYWPETNCNFLQIGSLNYFFEIDIILYNIWTIRKS